MPKIAKELSALAVSKLTKAGWNAVGGVPGLGLKITADGRRYWVLRKVVGRVRREIGLGPTSVVSLAMAKDRARNIADQIFRGIDPVKAKREARDALVAAEARALSFEQVASQYIEAHQPGWRNPKSAAQWRASLATYAYPVFGSTTVDKVSTPLILKSLEPIWASKSATASRLRGRIEQILDYATAKGLREGPNPARWRGHLALTLPATRKVRAVEHHEAVPVSEAPDFLRKLRQVDGVSARALEFVLLTASRSGETRGAVWAEIDLEAKVWTVPAARMKAGKEHRVPLSNAAHNLLKRLPGYEERTGYVFPSPKGKMLSDMSLSMCMRRMGITAVPHGLRSTFRDWAAELTAFPPEVVEMALAHAIGNAVEASYRRGDLFEKRRALMQDWASYLESRGCAITDQLRALDHQ